MRPRRAVVVTAASVLVTVTLTGTAAGAASDDDGGSKNSQLAEAQFEVHLLTRTSLVPTNVTCTLPPPTDENGAMVCFALVSDRDTVAALATLASSGGYEFTTVNKVDLAEPIPTGSEPVPPPDSSPDDPAAPEPVSPDPQTAADEVILDTIDSAVADSVGLSEVLREENAEIASIDQFDFFAPSATLQIALSTSTPDPVERDRIAFSVTDIMAYLWESDESLRDDSATIRPRLEVTVDGVLYSSSYDVMVGVADYTISFTEWLELATGGEAFKPVAKPAGK